MYLAHFGLNERPFAITPDPRFIYLTHRHREALAHLLYGLGEGGGFVQLTGEVGTGKTTVCRTLLHQLPENVDVALVFNPQLTVVELLRSVCEELHIDLPAGALSTKQLMDHLYAHLLDANARGRRTVLILDEAQNLSPELLEEVRLLTNLETDDSKLLQVFLIGQPELRTRLASKDLRQLAQRITARYHLDELTSDETRHYVRHRLSVAGASRDLFTPSALRLVHRLSRGIPRRINILCDRALLGGYARGRTIIAPATVRRAHAELSGPDRADTHPLRHVARFALLVAGLAIAAGAALRPDLAHGLADWAMTVPQLQPAKLAAAALRVPRDEPPVAAAGSPAAASAPVPAPRGPKVTASTQLAGDPTPGSPADAVAAPAIATANTLHALLGDVDGDAHDAAIALAALWKAASPPPDDELCRWAPRQGLACLDSPAGWPQLIGIGLPARLALDAGNGRVVHGMLRAVHAGTAVLELDGELHRVSEGEVSRRWTGESVVLWRPPLSGRGVLVPGQWDPGVAWLRGRLAVFDGEARSEQHADRFDKALEQRVMAFQEDAGLQVDGIIGPQTLIALDRRMPVPAFPSLADVIPRSSPGPAPAAVAMGSP